MTVWSDAMSFNFRRRLPIPMEIREEMPLSYAMMERKAHFDHVVADVMRGRPTRCS